MSLKGWKIRSLPETLLVKLQKFHVYLADLNPRFGTEPGKIRPVVVIQTDLLNARHPSTLICPLTTNIVREASVLRVHIPRGEAGLSQASDILVDQVRAVDNKRLIKRVGKIKPIHQEKLLENLRILLLE